MEGLRANYLLHNIIIITPHGDDIIIITQYHHPYHTMILYNVYNFRCTYLCNFSMLHILSYPQLVCSDMIEANRRRLAATVSIQRYIVYG